MNLYLMTARELMFCIFVVAVFIGFMIPEAKRYFDGYDRRIALPMDMPTWLWWVLDALLNVLVACAFSLLRTAIIAAIVYFIFM